jgi:hypothetical protein
MDPGAEPLLVSRAMSNPRATQVLSALLLLLLLAGCTSLKRVPLGPDPSYESQKLAGSSGLSIAGYSSPDGVFHAFHGKARWIGAARDSLELQGRRQPALEGAEPSGDPADKEAVTLRLARTDITTLVYRAPDGGKVELLGMGVITSMLAVGTVLLIIALAAMED